MITVNISLWAAPWKHCDISNSASFVCLPASVARVRTWYIGTSRTMYIQQTGQNHEPCCFLSPSDRRRYSASFVRVRLLKFTESLKCWCQAKANFWHPSEIENIISLTQPTQPLKLIWPPSCFDRWEMCLLRSRSLGKNPSCCSQCIRTVAHRLQNCPLKISNGTQVMLSPTPRVCQSRCTLKTSSVGKLSNYLLLPVVFYNTPTSCAKMVEVFGH